MGSLETLAKYRYQRALEDLAAAKEMLSGGMYKPSLNRSYYSIFHAVPLQHWKDLIPVNIAA